MHSSTRAAPTRHCTETGSRPPGGSFFHHPGDQSPKDGPWGRDEAEFVHEGKKDMSRSIRTPRTARSIRTRETFDHFDIDSLLDEVNGRETARPSNDDFGRVVNGRVSRYAMAA